VAWLIKKSARCQEKNKIAETLDLWDKRKNGNKTNEILIARSAYLFTSLPLYLLSLIYKNPSLHRFFKI